MAPPASTARSGGGPNPEAPDEARAEPQPDPHAAPEDPDALLAPLGARERGFVLGLLLSRGSQAQREDTAQAVSGPLGDRCANAIRRANGLPREGRLSLIRRLAGEVLGTGAEGLDVFAFPDDRLAQVLAKESTPILHLLCCTPATTPGDTLTVEAARELGRRTAADPRADWPTPSRDDLLELRRALLARLTVPRCTPVPPPGAPPGPRRRRPPDPNL